MTSRRVVLRSGAQARRMRPARRSAAAMTRLRVAALAWLVIDAGATYVVSTASAFGFRTLEVGPVSYTDASAIRGLLDVAPGSNLFALRTDPLAGRLRSLPPVADAGISASLPGTLVVRIAERRPVLVWAVGATSFLVDREGVVFAATTSAGSGDTAKVPLVTDNRADSASALRIGSRVDRIDLDAAARLASLTPADVGSAATSLTLALGDDSGFVLSSSGPTWTAVFGFYTPTLRTTDLIPGQVRLLRSLLGGREATVDRVILADATNGTYIPKSPAPSR
jgi:cell division septal protein FtsQ